jgi:hypothetical protein
MSKLAREIRRLATPLVVLAAILLPALDTAQGQVPVLLHSWVSHNGSDGNTCDSSAPCATFARALSKTAVGGEVSCLDSGGFVEFTVQFSVTIDCTGVVGTPSADYYSGHTCDSKIVINAPGSVVNLRGLNVTITKIPLGLPSSCAPGGILIQAATAVHIEDCVIENLPQTGILDVRTTGLTRLAIKNTIVHNIGGAGIVVAASAKNSAVLENVHSVGNTYGIAVAAGNNVVISRSVMSENSVAGIEADPGAYVYVENTKISQNASYGIYAVGTVGLANSDIAFNASSIFGTTMSYGNNRLFENGPGTAPTPVGATSTDFGQQ